MRHGALLLSLLACVPAAPLAAADSVAGSYRAVVELEDRKSVV